MQKRKKRKKESKACCGPGMVSSMKGCCKVDAVVPVDSRGQIVLPKELRKRAGIKEGEKIALISCETGGDVMCIALVKADHFAEMVKGALGPMLKSIME